MHDDIENTPIVNKSDLRNIFFVLSNVIECCAVHLTASLNNVEQYSVKAQSPIRNHAKMNLMSFLLKGSFSEKSQPAFSYSSVF